MIRDTSIAAFIAIASLGLAACEKQGTAEKMGEEVDEAVDTIKNGGEESLGTKVDDAVDNVREDARDIGEAVKEKTE
jgi:hypothetical protein